MSRESIKKLTPLLLLIFLDSLGYFLILPVLLRLYFVGAGNAPILPRHDSVMFRDYLYGVTLALSPLAAIIASPIVGHLSDSKGRKKTLFYCLLAAIIGFLIPIFGILYRKVSLVLLGRFIAGASTASQPIAQAAITDFSSGKQKALYLSLIACAMTLAMMLGPLAGGYLSDNHLVSWFNVSTPYWAGVIVAIINIMLMLWLYQETHPARPIKKKPILSARIKILLRALTQKKIPLLLCIFLCLEIAWSQYYQSIFLILHHHFHYTTIEISLYMTYIGVWMCIGLTLIYKLALKFLSLQQVLHYSLIGSCIGLVGCTVILSPLLQWLFIIPTAIFIGTSYPSLVATISNQSDPEHQGWVLGTVSTLLAIAWLITGFYSGILVSINILVPLIIAAISILLALALNYYQQHKG